MGRGRNADGISLAFEIIMARRFDDQIAIPAATATQLLPLMAAKGFTQTAMATFLSMIPDGDIYIGNSNAVSPTTGRLWKANAEYKESTPENNIIDLTMFWVYSVAGTNIHISAQGK